MDGISAIAQWGAVIVVAVGLVFSWRRNGKGSAEREGAFKNEVENIGKKLDRMDSGIDEIKTNTHKQEVHCATISTELMGRVANLEQEILKEK